MSPARGLACKIKGGGRVILLRAIIRAAQFPSRGSRARAVAARTEGNPLPPMKTLGDRCGPNTPLSMRACPLPLRGPWAAEALLTAFLVLKVRGPPLSPAVGSGGGVLIGAGGNGGQVLAGWARSSRLREARPPGKHPPWQVSTNGGVVSLPIAGTPPALRAGAARWREGKGGCQEGTGRFTHARMRTHKCNS